jgi:hypothetical protein
MKTLAQPHINPHWNPLSANVDLWLLGILVMWLAEPDAYLCARLVIVLLALIVLLSIMI